MHHQLASILEDQEVWNCHFQKTHQLLFSSIVNDGIREFYTFYEKIPHAQKAQKAQDVKQTDSSS